MDVPDPSRTGGGEEGVRAYFIRFSTSQRVQHVVLLLTFVVLSVTGLAQKYHNAGWADWVILRAGGIENTRLIHRIFGLMFTATAVYHFASLAYLLFVRHSRWSMVPNLKDVRDIVSVLKYHLGLEHAHPHFDRFDYRQKFEYWGIVFGGAVIIASGFTLMYPIEVTEVLPGQFVAAARELHGNEATLAVLTIVVWHLYEVIFRPGIFPIDTAIFSGKISKERMLEEHPLEYARLASVDRSQDGKG